MSDGPAQPDEPPGERDPATRARATRKPFTHADGFESIRRWAEITPQPKAGVYAMAYAILGCCWRESMTVERTVAELGRRSGMSERAARRMLRKLEGMRVLTPAADHDPRANQGGRAPTGAGIAPRWIVDFDAPTRGTDCPGSPTEKADKCDGEAGQKRPRRGTNATEKGDRLSATTREEQANQDPPRERGGEISAPARESGGQAANVVTDAEIDAHLADAERLATGWPPLADPMSEDRPADVKATARRLALEARDPSGATCDELAEIISDHAAAHRRGEVDPRSVRRLRVVMHGRLFGPALEALRQRKATHAATADRLADLDTQRAAERAEMERALRAREADDALVEALTDDEYAAKVAEVRAQTPGADVVPARHYLMRTAVAQLIRNCGRDEIANAAREPAEVCA